MKIFVQYRLLYLLMLLAACKQAYEPPVIKAPNRFLVVEGVINATAGGRTTILLSRTRNLLDTILTDPERSARVQIESRNGIVYNLTEQSAGRYISIPLTLNTNETYRLKIVAGGREYISDYVPVKLTPPIDSLTWKQDKDVTIYANTHDPQNNTRYYRWDFTETWQYRAEYETLLGVNNGMIYYRDPSEMVYNCWSEAEATQIVLATSVKLSQDVIDHAPIRIILQHSERIGIRYSMLARQYGLTEDAYKYWEILQKNTQQLGTLFDAQPSQLKGNIHSVSDPNEPVIGYASAAIIQEKRMFIDNADLVDWSGGLAGPDCTTITIQQSPPPNPFIYTYADTSYAPYYFTSGGVILAKKICLDCRRRGGTNQKPSFW